MPGAEDSKRQRPERLADEDSADRSDATVPRASPTYSAPALEKGIDILELLAAADGPKNLTEIAQGLGRSKNEIFRMLAVLELRGLIARRSEDDAFSITDRLFALRRQRADTRHLTVTALPWMERYSARVGQSCHLALRTDDEIIVILRTEAMQSVSLLVAIGHRQSLSMAPSGRCMLAFSPRRDVDHHLEAVHPSMGVEARAALLEDLATIPGRGYCIMQDGLFTGVTGISVPILEREAPRCCAAITTAVLRPVAGVAADVTGIAEALRETARGIEQALWP